MDCSVRRRAILPEAEIELLDLLEKVRRCGEQLSADLSADGIAVGGGGTPGEPGLNRGHH